MLKMYKFHLINTKKMSSKTRCDQVLSFGEIHFYGDKILVFTICLKQNFLDIIKLGSTAPECPLGYEPACKGKVSHLDENIAALCFWLKSSKVDDLRTNAFSTSTKRKSHEKLYFGFVGHHCRGITGNENKCIFYL